MMFIKIFNLIVFLFSTVLFSQVDYSSEIQPIFNNNCVNCHDSDHSSGLDLSSYSNFIPGNSINPYNHSASELFIRISISEGSNGNMPPNNTSLSQNEINLIAQWIDEGALQNPGSSSGCTDPEAYNCADDNGINYTFGVNSEYVNGCNYYNNDFNELTYEGGCENGPCEGMYNPGATSDNGSCDYYQSPNENDVEFLLTSNGININWSNFTPPQNSNVIGYILQRCISTCDIITGNPFPWPNGSGIGYTDTSFEDLYNWESELENCPDCDGQIKYTINVHYSNAESFGMAMGIYYFSPSCSCLPGDVNGDNGWNVLDIVLMANWVLDSVCVSEGAPANCCCGDMNIDDGYNVLDIVALSNCVLSENCGQ